MKHKQKLVVLGALAAILVLAYLLIDVGSHWDYVLPRRGKKIMAVLLTGSAIAFSTVVFQTIINNRILTPSIIGLDSLYLLFQTAVVFVAGSETLTMMNKQLHFIINVGLMVLFASLLYKILFQRENQNIYYLLLLGIICGTFFQNVSSFMQMLIDPNEFQVVQGRMFASLSNVNGDLLWIAGAGMVVAVFYFRPYIQYLDVLSLGREQAINLGVSYDRVVKQLLVLVAILTAIATALVGPITFLGLLVANIAYRLLKTHRHVYLIPGAILISIVALVGGQLVVERVFSFTTTLSVIINFLGGIVFIYLLLKESRL
ncbi:MAG: iron chelate uptake ABC transporter family permease subunit [Clostridia bacterium]|jgi:iron complex transport system permease protein|nr:iron chelate uptake ABC transporter family permease subunit [Clostridia bacterium]